MKDSQLIEMDLADTIIDRPHGFSVGSRHFYLYPVTLGKMFLLNRLTDELQINEAILKANPYIEMLRLANLRKGICSQILAYHTIRTKAKIFDNEFVRNRSKWFEEQIDVKDLARFMSMVMTAMKLDDFMKNLKLDREQRRLERVMRVKRDKNNISFGCLSIYGNLIDAACERYHWTFDYVVWEISYINLKLMLADKATSIFVSDEERKKLPPSVFASQTNIIKADDPKNRELIKQMSWR